MNTRRITVLVLNGATGEVREVVANVTADDEQSAVNKLFYYARRDDYYYRFLGRAGGFAPTEPLGTPVQHDGHTFYALEN